jgi:hypothetical protein
VWQVIYLMIFYRLDGKFSVNSEEWIIMYAELESNHCLRQDTLTAYSEEWSNIIEYLHQGNFNPDIGISRMCFQVTMVVHLQTMVFQLVTPQPTRGY